MSLQLKFAILLAALAGAVFVALGVARWTLDVTYREVREPVQSGSKVLLLLVDIEQHVDALRGLLDPSESFRMSPVDQADASVREIDRAAFESELGAVDGLLKLIREEQWTAYAGRSASENFSRKVLDFRQTSEALLNVSASSTPTEVGRLSTALFQIHELLKRMERRVVVDIQELTGSSRDLRARLGIVLGLALTLVLLTGSLAFLLVRRWVVHPVANLRTATARIAAGDFEHRIPIAVAAPRDEITSLSAEVNHMAGMVKQLQVERVEQERLAAIGELVRRLAHNLRNPLSGIRGLAEMTRSDAASLGPAGSDVREAQSRIISAVDRFEGWLSALLNVTKPTQIQAEPTDTTHWLSGLVDAHRPMAQTRGVRVDLDQSAAPATAVVDARHLEHAVSAILSNAIEASAATPAATRVMPPTVRIVSRVAENGKAGPIWELRIEDTGPGVPPDLRESVFKPYFTTKKDGNGIGLAVTQQVVRAHGGRVHVEDAQPASSSGEDGKGGLGPHGAAFVIRLPLAQRPAEATPEEVVARASQ